MIKIIRKNYKKNRGVATLEILFAFAILIMNMTGIMLLINSGQSIYVDTETNQEALNKADVQIEAAKVFAKQDFNLVSPTSPITDDIYQKSLLVEQVDLFTKKVTSNVIWKTDGNRNQVVNLSTLITNPDALSGGDTCSSVLAGDWTNPQKTEYEFGADILGDTSSGFPITSIQSFNKKMYVTVDNDNGNNPGTFFVLDITNPAIKPPVLGEFDNNLDVGRGLNAVAVDGSNYAYVASANGSNFTTCTEDESCSQLQVIDVSSPSSMSLVATYKIPGVTGQSGQSVGQSIAYKNGIVYLGLAKATGPEFHIIDVGGANTPSASPTNPIKIGSYEMNSAVNSIQIKGNYAYVASPDNQELKILNISNPTNPTLVGGFDAPGGGANNGNGKSIYLVGDKLYFGRTLLNGSEFYILNNTNQATNLPVLGSANIQNGGSNSSVNGLIIRNHLAFLITNAEFQILRIDNPSNITQYAAPLVLPPGTGGGLQGTATDCEGNYVYVGSQSSNDKGYISVITGS
ncbi:MAG: hypothetical protein M3Q34_00750 [bacterium]|nr:hypothetical protein [bacterium]